MHDEIYHPSYALVNYQHLKSSKISLKIVAKVIAEKRVQEPEANENRKGPKKSP